MEGNLNQVNESFSQSDLSLLTGYIKEVRVKKKSLTLNPSKTKGHNSSVNSLNNFLSSEAVLSNKAQLSEKLFDFKLPCGTSTTPKRSNSNDIFNPKLSRQKTRISESSGCPFIRNKLKIPSVNNYIKKNSEVSNCNFLAKPSGDISLLLSMSHQMIKIAKRQEYRKHVQSPPMRKQSKDLIYMPKSKGLDLTVSNCSSFCFKRLSLGRVKT